MGEETSMRKTAGWEYLPIFFMVVCVPAIVCAKQYSAGLLEYAWFSGTDSVYDFFLYWKSRLIIFTGFLTLACFLLKAGYRTSGKHEKSNLSGKPFLCLVVYAFFILLSAFLAENKYMAFWGGFEQFESGLVLLSYLLVSYYTYLMIKISFKIENICFLLLAGMGIVSIIGAFQAMTLDFFQNDLGQMFMKMTEPSLIGQSLKFNFGVGRTYAAQYNPNYIGSYVALCLPFTVAGCFVFKSNFKKCILALISFFLLLSLIGSESMTGYLALLLTAILLFVLFIPLMKKYWKQLACIVGICIFAAAILCFIKPDAITYAYNKIFYVAKNEYAVQKFGNEDGKLAVYTRNKRMLLDMTGETKEDWDVSAYDMSGNKLECSHENSVYTISSEEFLGFTISRTSLTLNNDSTIYGMKVSIDGKNWQFIKQDELYYYVNFFGRIDEIKEIPYIGFENSQHFASRRGYIWSRTLPLISEHILTGCGPDNFVLAFPNDDYVGLENNDYSGNIITKPHNMYLQIAVQTGLVSLIAFLVFYIHYFIGSIRMFFKIKNYGSREITALGLFLGTFGYIITGLANDSSITVAPVFWVMIGAGIAVNQLLCPNKTSD